MANAPYGMFEVVIDDMATEPALVREVNCVGELADVAEMLANCSNHAYGRDVAYAAYLLAYGWVTMLGERPVDLCEVLTYL